jgi:hypothetical protein
MPVNETLCVPIEASSLTVRVPLRENNALGLKVTATVQPAPAARLVPQALDCEKSPLTAMLVKLSGAVPLLVIVMFCAALVAPTF